MVEDAAKPVSFNIAVSDTFVLRTAELQSATLDHREVLAVATGQYKPRSKAVAAIIESNVRRPSDFA